MSKFSRIVFLIVLLLAAAGIAVGQTVHWRLKLNTGQIGQIIAGPNDTDPAILTAVQSTGNVGIGVVDPGASRLTIRGVDTTSSNYGLKVENGAGAVTMVARNDNRVGIGTTSPWTRLLVEGPAGYLFGIDDTSGVGSAFFTSSAGAAFGTYSPHSFFLMSGHPSTDVPYRRAVITSGDDNYLGTNNDWKMGVGVNPLGGPNPDARLTVCRRGSLEAGINCAYPSISPTVVLLGSHDNSTTGSSLRARGSVVGGLADIGEYVKVAGDASSYEQGDALAMESGVFKKSAAAYDQKVAGIVTTTAGLIAGGGDETITFDKDGKPTNRVVMALAGQLPAKVLAENGPIQVGDLLTTASAPGYLMKCPTDTSAQKLQCVGTIVAKALEPLESGNGKIMVLLTLQ